MQLERVAAPPAQVDEAAVERELMEYLGERPENVPPVREPWRINTLGAADWAMRQLRDAQRLAQQYRDEIALWTAALNRIAHAGEWFEERLREWAISQRTDQHKSFSVAHGTVSTRSSKARAVVVDEPAAIAWAKEHGRLDAVKVTESFLISEAGVFVAALVVGFESTNKLTGDMEQLAVTPAPLNEHDLAKLRETLGDGYVVEPILELFACTTIANGDEPDTVEVVPGLAVAPEKVTASVKPLGL